MVLPRNCAQIWPVADFVSRKLLAQSAAFATIAELSRVVFLGRRFYSMGDLLPSLGLSVCLSVCQPRCVLLPNDVR